MFQCSEALVSGALKAASLPLELLQAYPNVVDLGRPTIVKLHKQFFELSEADRETVLEKCRTQSKSVWAESEAQGIARLTKEVSEHIEGWISEFAPKAKPAPAKQELLKGRAHYTRKGTNLAINLKKVDDGTMEEILAYIESKLS
jgi:ParB family chromosome partitioning protein